MGDFDDTVKFSMSIPVSTELAMALGALPDYQVPRPPYVPTRRERIAQWWSGDVYYWRIRTASFIAGFDVEEER